MRQRYFEEVGRYRLTMCFRKSAGTVRSRRCQSAKKGVGGGSHQQAKSEISAGAEISDFSHLYIQMPSLQGSATLSNVPTHIKMAKAGLAIRLHFCQRSHNYCK